MTVLGSVYFIAKSLDPMPLFYWWSAVQGANLSLYGGLNVVQKKIQPNNGGK
jgi:hypothetical protein